VDVRDDPGFQGASATRPPGTILAARRRSIVAWYKVSGGRLGFRGRVTRKPFRDWAATPEGAAAVDAVARELGFCLFGKTRTARRRMWRELEAAVADESVKAVLHASAEHYTTALAELAYAPALPRVAVALRRLVVIPRTMVAARGRSALNARLMACPAYADLNESLRAFLCHRLVLEMDDAVRRAKPSARRPVEAKEAWTCVGLDERFVWIDPLWSGRDWLGHVFMFEMPERASRKERRELEAAIETLQGSLPELSQVQRDGTVRSASAGLRPVNA
jgi:hypothetical protein